MSATTKQMQIESKAKILLVEDNEAGRREMSALIGSRLGYQVCSPDSLYQLREAFTFELFDGLLVDLELSNFDDIGGKLDGVTIDDGNDVLAFYRNLHQVSLFRLYSSHTTFPFDREIKEKIDNSPFPITTLPKPLPRDMQQIVRLFEPIFDEVEDVYRSNPLFQPLSYYKERQRAKSLRAYKNACRLHSNWFNFNLRNVGDRAWGVICGRTADRSCYGQPLNGNGHEPEFKVEGRDSYPSITELKALSLRADAFAFVIWNTRDLRFVEKQFALAGTRLGNIPEYLRDYFGIAMVQPCVGAYQEGSEEKVFEWAADLMPLAQVEIVRALFKIHWRKLSIAPFSKQCEDAHLPVVVEMYNCKVDRIEPDKQIAWVELKNLGSSRTVSVEPFDLNQMGEHGIDHELQTFEYMVYRDPYDHVVMSIEPLEPLE